MTHCYPRPPMRWNGAIGVIERCKRVSTVCVPKSRSKQELRSICGEKPKAKGVSRPFKPYMKRVQDDSNPVPLPQSPQEHLFFIDSTSLWSLTRDTIKFAMASRKKHIDTAIVLEMFTRYSTLLSYLSG